MPSSYRYVITQGLDFTLKEAMNSHMNFADHIPLTMLGTHFLTGATAGLVSFTVLYPEDIITNPREGCDPIHLENERAARILL